MDDKILYTDLQSDDTMDKFIKKKLIKLDNITLMETLNDVIFRRIFIGFIQIIHSPQSEFESMNLLKRYSICQKILTNHESFNDDEIFDKLIKYSPNFLWEQKIRGLLNRGERDLNFIYVMEKLKWETIIELICHNDYKTYLTAIKLKSKIIRELIREIYKIYHF